MVSIGKLQRLFPDEKIYKEKLCDLEKQKVTVGTFTHVLNKEDIRLNLASHKAMLHGEVCDEKWWNTYAEDLEEFRGLRNRCCHSESMNWEMEEKILQILFERKEFTKTMVGEVL